MQHGAENSIRGLPSLANGNGAKQQPGVKSRGSVVQLVRNLSMGTEKDVELLARFPPKQQLGEHERVLTAAMCVIRALDREGPIYCPNRLVLVFKVVNNINYLTVLRALALFHATVLCALEVPPRLYSASDDEIERNGYYTAFPRVVDATVCVVYILHCLMVRLIDRTQSQSTVLSFNTLLYGVVGLLCIDTAVSLSVGFAVRPFRWLRPLIYVLLTPILRTMLQSCAATFVPLVKTFLVLVGAQVFFATMGLNLFSGYASDSNPFGAACMNGTGAPHPFQNFGWSFVTMYIATTGDNHPSVIWPFYTCDCSMTPVDVGITTLSGKLPWCATRRVVSMCFFMTFMAIVFFCLGNCVLAVCYFFFDQISKTNVTRSMIKQRLSIVTAFYYLDRGSGNIEKQDFVAVSQAVSRLSNYPIHKISEQLFELLDPNSSGSLSLTEMFGFPDMVRTRLILHNEEPIQGLKRRPNLYARWKSSALRRWLFNALQVEVFEMPALELAVVVMMMLNFLFFTIESTRTSAILGHFSDLLIVVFVVEAVWKILAYGVQTYWIDSWNRFDFAITVLSVLFYLYDQLVTTTTPAEKNHSTSGLFSVIQCVRLLRMLKLLSFVLGGTQQIDINNAEEASQHRADVEAGHLKRRARTKELNYFQQLLLSLATTIPTCVNILILLFLFMCSFATLGMEILSTYDTNTKVQLVGNTVVNYIHGTKMKFDWADWSSSITSVMVVIVGNTWSALLVEAMVRTRFGIVAFFLVFHFLGKFLILNIIQSLFVFAFSTLLDVTQFHQTIEADLAGRAQKLSLHPKVKKIWRAPRLEYLMLTKDDLEVKYSEWKTQHRGSMVLGKTGVEMPLSPRRLMDTVRWFYPGSGRQTAQSPLSPNSLELPRFTKTGTVEEGRFV